MFRPLSCSYRRPHRRGTSFILIVVVMLSLFSAVGTAYALFAMREAKLALMRKEEQGGGTSAQLQAPNPDSTVNKFFSTLLSDDQYDNPTDPTYAHLFNALRGHSIGRSMYGFDSLNPYNTTPWNGVGLFHEQATVGGGNVDRATVVNHTWMKGVPLFDPEYTGVRTLGSDGKPVALDTTTRTYIGKNAGYSYADLKDFFLATYDPATGEVLAPSFHRDWLTGGPNSLAPGSNFWNDPDANAKLRNRLKTLRPWPEDHPNFPRVPPNQDGVTYTGDVQNLPGGIGPQKNDSIWIDIGAQVITLPGNRKVKPLVAPLILPLNALIDVNSHGTIFYSGGQGGYHGFGPWEVSMNPVLGTDAAALISTPIKGRGPAQTRRQVATRSFNIFDTNPLPSYSPVAWNSTVVGRPGYPNDLSGLPTFTGFQSDNTAATNHPSLFNPSEWSSTTTLSNRIFPISEIKRLNGPYANTHDTYNQSEVAALAPNELLGGAPATQFILAPGKTTPSSYRLDPTHYKRGLVTTLNYELQRPKLMPMYAGRDSNLLSIADPTLANPNPKPTSVSPGVYPALGSTGRLNDFTSPKQWSNIRAALGSVDLNRQLRDYRTNLNQPLSAPGNITTGSQANADNDRVLLARDIFRRLVIALGGAAFNDPNQPTGTGLALPDPATLKITVPASAGGGEITVTQQQYNALRYLAQLSVNIVDYIDNDDISTVFTWNPPLADPTIETAVSGRVVYGVEKPRLVINEAYGELTNDPADPVNGDIIDATVVPPKRKLPEKPCQARFWVELLNPTTTPTLTTGPLGDGSVPLETYRIQISRANRPAGPITQPTGQTGDLASYLLNPANTKGLLGDPAAGAVLSPDATYTFTGLPAASKTLLPNDKTYTGAPGGPAKGVVLVGPKVTKKTDSEEFAPTGAIWTNMIGTPVPDSTAPGGMAGNPKDGATASTTMGYVFDMPATNDAFSDPQFKRHVVLLQRLANPYVAFTPSNPYITVDVMDYVPAFDAVHRGKDNGDNRVARGSMKPGGGMSTDGYDPVTGDEAKRRFSVGKVQPYAGRSIANESPLPSGYGNYSTYTFPKSMVLKQAAANDGEPMNTFGRHNGKSAGEPPLTFPAGTITSGAETIMTPFDWFVHMDRPLVNQFEMLQVRDTAPFRVTDQFVNATAAGGGGSGVTFENAYPHWIDDGFMRALEYLTVRPYTAGIGHGGRVPGKININAIQDKRILQALMDPQSGNFFDATFVDNFGWNGWINSRTQVGSALAADQVTPINRTQAPSPSIFDTKGAIPPGVGVSRLDRPFLPLGAAIATPSADGFFFGGSGVGIDDTVLRRDTTTLQPYLFTTPTGMTPASQPNGPSYFRVEPARKIMNNITTVNHQYIVFLTIGYFDVVGTPVQLAPDVTTPQLGAEAFISIPGDMRQKFVAVVDMSNMGLKPVDPAVSLDPDTNRQATDIPFFTSLESTTYTANGPSAVLNIAYSRYDSGRLFVITADGTEVDINPNPTTRTNYLVVGYGDEQQVVKIGNIGTTPGEVQVETVSGANFKNAWAGTCVSNFRPGFPGPQGGFNYTDPKYKGVLPYVERLK